jgi:hypothetical protein
MGSCAPFSYNDAQFRAQFPAFANQSVYAPTTLSMYFCTAQSFVENTQYGFMNGCATQLALNLLTAHFAALASAIAQGQTPGIETQATIDKISVSIMEPPVKNMWQYWLAQTPYGQQLLAMLQAQSVGGFYAPGGAGRAGFRW